MMDDWIKSIVELYGKNELADFYIFIYLLPFIKSFTVRQL